MTKEQAITDLEELRNLLLRKSKTAWFTYNRRRYWNMAITLHIALVALKS